MTEFLCLSHDGKSPHILTRVYVPRDLAPADAPGESPGPEGVAAMLTKPHAPLAEVQERVCARLPTAVEATTFRISSTLAVLEVNTTGRIVEAALLVLPGDRADAVFATHHTTDDRRAEDDASQRALTPPVAGP